MTLSEKHENFILVAKRILKSKLSKNKDTLLKYKDDIVQSYNDFIQCALDLELSFIEKDQESYNNLLEHIQYIRSKFNSCLDKLNYTYHFNNDLFEIVISDLITEKDNPQDNNKMAPPTPMEFINAFSKIIPEFNGDQEKLQTCLDALELVRINSEGNVVTAVSMIKAKLTGRARNCISNEDDTVEKIINKLRVGIKGETTDVLIAKLQNVKQSGKSANTYIKEIEGLTNLLKTAYISDGLTPILSEKYATNQAVLAMRNNASNDRIKLVMEAGKFDNLNEAVAKFIGTTNDSNNQPTILYASQNNRNNRGNRRSSNYNNNNYNNHNANNFRQYYNNSNTNFNNYRGRGNFRGNRGFSRGNHFNNRRGNNNGSYVRYLNDQGNSTNPQYVNLGESQTNQQQMTNP